MPQYNRVLGRVRRRPALETLILIHLCSPADNDSVVDHRAVPIGRVGGYRAQYDRSLLPDFLLFSNANLGGVICGAL